MNTTALDSRREGARQLWQAFEASPHPQIFIGASSCGRAAGAMDVWKAAEEALAELGPVAQGTTISEVGCIGPCYLEPLMDVKLPGKPRISFSNVDPKRVRGILTNLMKRDTVPTRGVVGHFGEEGDLEGVPRFFDHPMLASQVRLVLRNCGLIDPSSIDHYLARDGYAGLVDALARAPADVIEIVKGSGLRGRGGAGFPTWRKWLFCRQTPSDQRYMICNADEGDPGAFMDRSVIEGDPHAMLEGLAIAAYAIGASKGYVYIRAEYPLAIQRLELAITQMRELGLLGEDILGSGFDFDVKIKQGAGAFVCGEETALIASIEGRRGMPRSRPPFPASSGLWGKPTIINNVETLANLPGILRQGAEWFAGYGTATSKGTKTFALVGRIRRKGLVEVPMGTTLRQVVEEIGGGLDKPFKAVQTGGPSGGCLSTEHLDTPIDYESLAAAGSIMGSGGLIVLDEDTCVVDVARYFLEFTQQESCGKCVPCRVGTRHLVDILVRITQGKGQLADLDRLDKLGQVVRGASLCGLGQSAPNPVLSTLKLFRDEYLAHIEGHRCPAAVCRDLVVFRVNENCNGCGRCVPVCPVQAISGKRAESYEIDPSKCITCRACYEICRFDAISGDPVQATP